MLAIKCLHDRETWVDRISLNESLDNWDVERLIVCYQNLRAIANITLDYMSSYVWKRERIGGIILFEILLLALSKPLQATKDIFRAYKLWDVGIWNRTLNIGSSFTLGRTVPLWAPKLKPDLIWLHGGGRRWGIVSHSPIIRYLYSKSGSLADFWGNA